MPSMAVEEHKAAEETIKALRAEVAKLREERDILRDKLDALARQLFGKKSERITDSDLGPLFPGVEQPEIPPAPHQKNHRDPRPGLLPARGPRRA